MLLAVWPCRAAAAARRTRSNPANVWLDDRGQQIQAHGGGILKMGDTYYWFGEDRGAGQ